VSDQDSSKKDEPDDASRLINESGITPLDAVAVQLNEVYESLKRAGFNPLEAIQMVTGLLSGMMQYSPMGVPDEFDDKDDYNNDEDDNDDWDLPENDY
jgi:uncharacterized protein (UPF0297 family)